MPHEATITFTLDTQLSRRELETLLGKVEGSQYGNETIAMLALLGDVDDWHFHEQSQTHRIPRGDE